MKKSVAVIVTFAVALAIWFILSKAKTVPPVASPEKFAAEDAAVASTLAKQNPKTVAIIESNFARVQPVQVRLGSVAAAAYPAGSPSPLQFTNFPPAIVLENMSRAIRQSERAQTDTSSCP